MELTKETRERIFSAADSLYDHAGRANFPTVDAVRKTARVNMNDASAGMKEWRRAQTAQAAPVAAQVPEPVQQASSQALATLWAQAQELANESLRAAQAGWDAERIEAETLNRQMGDAYDVQAAELETANRRIEELTATHQAEQQRAGQLAQQLEEMRSAKLTTENRAAIAEQRAEEIERRATELRRELDHAHQEDAKARAELVGVRQTHESEIQALRAELLALQNKTENAAEKAAATAEALRAELATVKAKAEAAQETHQEHRIQTANEVNRSAELLTIAQAEYHQAQKDAGKAREDAAALGGQLDSLKDQNAKLLQALQMQGEKLTSKPKKLE